MPAAAQVFRIRRDADPDRGSWTAHEFAFGITSLPGELAGPRQLAAQAGTHQNGDGAGTGFLAVPSPAVAALSAAGRQRYVLAHGMSAAFALATAFDVATLLLAIFLFRGTPRPQVPAEPAAAHADRDMVRVPDTSDSADLD